MSDEDEEFLQHMDTQPLGFGKFKGQTPQQLLSTAPAYIQWMYGAISPKVCSAKLVKDATEQIALVNQQQEENRGRPRRASAGYGGATYTGPEKGGGCGYGGFDDMDDDVPY